MCDKCLYLCDDEAGVDYAPTHAGTGMRPGIPKRPYSSFGYDKQPNLNNIRFGTKKESNIPGWKRRPSYNKDERIDFDPAKTDYSLSQLEQLADQFLRDDARAINSETGKQRGIGGKDPILFAEHLYQRQKREILNENGVPEPGLVSGMYTRSHPEGRKINSAEARLRHGSSYYRLHDHFPCTLVDCDLSALNRVEDEDFFLAVEL